jgi:hypothetical protein
VFKLRNIPILLAVAGLLAVQCTRTETPGESPVARVGEKVLLQTDIKQIVPTGLSPADSTAIAGEYIKKWIRQELLIHKANENLSVEQKDLTREIEEYRNSLIVYKYKNALLSEQMDTVVTQLQIEQYYNTNADDFKLTSNIVKGIFMKIPLGIAKPSELKKMVEDDSEQGITALKEYCLKFAISFESFADRWVDFRIVRRYLPIEIEDPAQELKRNNLIEQKDAENYYMVSIQNYKLQNEPAPIEYVQDNIRNLILNQRKIQFLQQIEENVYKEGLRQNKFKIFVEQAN